MQFLMGYVWIDKEVENSSGRDQNASDRAVEFWGGIRSSRSMGSILSRVVCHCCRPPWS